MCGLFAGVGKLNSNRIVALGSMNEERGTDSVGLAYMNGEELRIAKIAERPCVGLNITLRKEVTEAAVSGMFIGHTRQATQGSVSDRNAHPFLDSGIAFAHNGIIINDDAFGKYEVDSESLIHGIKARDFSKYEGPVALVWIEDGKLHAYRCGNPLYRGRHNGSTYLASEGDYLKEIGCTKVKQLTEGMVYTFQNAFTLTTQTVRKNKPFSYAGYGAGAKGYHNDVGYTGAGWEDYLDAQYGRKAHTDMIPYTPKGQGTASLPSVIDGNVKEDFRTPSDLVKEAREYMTDYCDTCGEIGELTEGYCLSCIEWMDEQGIGIGDLPSVPTETRGN